MDFEDNFKAYIKSRLFSELKETIDNYDEKLTEVINDQLLSISCFFDSPNYLNDLTMYKSEEDKEMMGFVIEAISEYSDVIVDNIKEDHFYVLGELKEELEKKLLEAHSDSQPDKPMKYKI